MEILIPDIPVIEKLVPVWDIPEPCLDRRFDGAFCDDDGSGAEPAHDRLSASSICPAWSAASSLAHRPSAPAKRRRGRCRS